MTVKFKLIYSIIFSILALQIKVYSQELINQESNEGSRGIDGKRHFVAFNPIKPFIGLPNIHYEYQIKKKIGFTAFSEVLAYTVIPDFNHPDAVNTIGLSFYPFMNHQVTNQGVFVNINSSYIVYFNDDTNENSFANGVQIGYKYLLKKSLFIEPKLVLNYTYKKESLSPGFEILLGLNF